MDLTEAQLAEYRAKLFEDLGEEYPFPDDLVPKHYRVESKVPFMTFVGCLGEFFAVEGILLSCGGFWGHFCLSPGDRKTEFALNWRRSETVVRYFSFVSDCLTLYVVFFLVDLLEIRVLYVNCVSISGPSCVVVDDQAYYNLRSV